MRGLREQPRLAAAKLAIYLAALIAAGLVGSALASDSSGTAADLRPRLERIDQLRRAQASELQDLAAQVTKLRADLRTARRQARISKRLRRDPRAVRRSLAQ